MTTLKGETMVVDGRAPWWKVEPGGDVTRGAFEVTSDYRENGTKYVEGVEVPLADELNMWKRLVAECGEALRVWSGWRWQVAVAGEVVTGKRGPKQLADWFEEEFGLEYEEPTEQDSTLSRAYQDFLSRVDQARRAVAPEAADAQPTGMLGNTALGDITLIGRYSPAGRVADDER